MMVGMASGGTMEKHSPASIKAAVLERITHATGPVHRSTLYRVLHGDRYREAFDQATQELLESEAIVQTESHNGTHGRIAVSSVPAPHD